VHPAHAALGHRHRPVRDAMKISARRALAAS
jgi:hypothetical protein